MPQKSNKQPIILLPILLWITLATLLLYRFGESWLRHLLLYLSTASWARSLVSTMPLADRVASRFVAGETISDAIKTTKQLNNRGMLVTLDYLGESVTTKEEAVEAGNEILRLLDQIEKSQLNANVSVKLSQIGLKLDEQLAIDIMTSLLERAASHGNKIRIDMEESSLVDITLNIYRNLRYTKRFENVGVVLQSYLYRSEDDIAKLIDEGAWIRLCKGAYMEPPEIAFPEKQDTDKNFIKLTHMLLGREALENGVYLGIASHDEAMINASKNFARDNQISLDDFEFQMLYGIRRDLQESLVNQGYRMRIYVPYGTAWYPYFVRRLAERPANLWFFIANLLRR